MARLGRLAFLGTGAFAVPLLAQLPARTDELLVIAAPDRPAGRRLRSRQSPVAAAAHEGGLDLATPERLASDEGRSLLRGFAPDGILLAAYGQLIPPDLLALGSRPPLNVHPSLLPRHRGAAPVAATIVDGDRIAGVSLMVMVGKLDAGPIVAQWPVPLTGREEAPELEARLAQLAAEVVPPLLAIWAEGSIMASPQDERRATMTHPFTRADGWIRWDRPADETDRQVRALQPWPGAWTTLGDRRLHIRRAQPVEAAGDLPAGTLLPGRQPRVACGAGALLLELVQPEGRPAMTGEEWRRGMQRDHLRLGVNQPS